MSSPVGYLCETISGGVRLPQKDDEVDGMPDFGDIDAFGVGQVDLSQDAIAEFGSSLLSKSGTEEMGSTRILAQTLPST
jgi:hypothetical protein